MKSTVFFTEKDILETIKTRNKGGKKMRRKGKQILAAATAAALLLSGCGGGAGESKEGTSEQTAASGDKMTDVGTPRKDTLIVDMLSGTQTDPDNFNPI